jgi:hemerythrin
MSSRQLGMISEYDWRESYSVGNVIIDQQHKKILMLCAESAKCLESTGPEGCEKFHDLLHEMAICTREHFAKEEALLLARNYPMLVEHAEEHERFQVAVANFLFAATQGELDRIGVFRFLSEWWVHHILVSDLDCRSYLAERCALPQYSTTPDCLGAS